MTKPNPTNGRKGRSGRKPSPNPKRMISIRIDPKLLKRVKARQPKRPFIEKVEEALQAWLER